MKKRDFVFLAAVFFAAALFFTVLKLLPDSDTVCIYKDSVLFGEYSLSEAQVIDIDGTNTAEIRDGCIFMTDASCPDKLCIKQGKLSDSSRTIVCLPNKVVISVKPQAQDADAVTQ